VREISPWHNQHPTQHSPSGSDIQYVYALESAEHSPRDYWRMVVRQRRLVILVCLMVLALGFYLSLQATPLYTATITLQLRPRPVSLADLAGAKAEETDDFGTQVTMLKSRALAAKVINKLQLMSNPKFVDAESPMGHLRYWLINWPVGWLKSAVNFLSKHFRPASPPETAPQRTPVSQPTSQLASDVHPSLINRYQRFLTVSPIPKTELVQLSFTTPDPYLSQELANTHAAVFIHTQLQTRFELTQEAREYLEKKLFEVKAKIEQAETALNQFLQAHTVVSLERNENIVVSRMMELNTRLTAIKTKRIELESLNQIVRNKNAQYLTEIMNNTQIQRLKANLDALQDQQGKLSTIFKGDHPRLQELSQQISETQQRLNLEIANIVRGIESDYAAARAKEAAFESEVARQRQAVLSLKELSVEYTILQGEVAANRTVYESLHKRLSESSISSDTPLTHIQIADPAELPLGPSSPNIQRNMLIASMLGLSLGAGLAFLIERLNPKIITSEDVWRTVALPTLGVVPHTNSLRRQVYGFAPRSSHSFLRRVIHLGGSANDTLSRGLVVAQHPFSIFSDSYRTTRTAILLAQARSPLQVVLFTSANPSEGKTVTLLNLAITLAQSGRRVVVVDADLRRGNCHTLLGLPNRNGLTAILYKRLTLEECVQKTGIERLFLLPRGVVPANSTDLLGSPEMKGILQGLREHFDIILIDSPPVIAVSDAVILSTECDGVLLVFHAHKTTTEAAHRVVETLKTADVRILGAVLNGVDLRSRDYAYYRRSYQAYSATSSKGTKEES
jgi:polysaccharide biosynthesis transport protein